MNDAKADVEPESPAADTPPKTRAPDTGADHAHLGDKEYVLIALFLAVVTGAEVGLYYVEVGFLLSAILLCIMMVVKFATVAMYFMHLRFDSKLFRNFFLTGLFLATGCYLTVLTTFHFWTG